LLSIYMERRLFALDFLGDLWYHIRVKLGCYATASHGFDSVFRALLRGSAPGRDRVTAMARSFFEGQGKTNEFCLSCPICVSLFSAESPRYGHASSACLRECPTAGKADTGGRAGEVRSGISASRYVDGSIIPALANGFSRAVS
jgi:hypothetical protein